MHHSSLRRIAPFTAAAVLVAAAPAGAQTGAATIAVDAAQDSVLVTGLGFGSHTVQVTRPDARTGAPVVIGQYRGFGFPGLPFSVNTTTPSPLNPGGDCWQKGGLTLPGNAGLTPDILSGDTVSVVGGASLKVTDDAPDGTPGGPIAGCDALSTWGRNGVATAVQHSAGADLELAGKAQPLTTGVELSVSDGTNTTDGVDAKPAADGTWTATIPAAALSALAPGRITVGATFAVSDVATGAPAHIAGTSLQAAFEASPTPAPAGGQAGEVSPPAGPVSRPDPKAVVRLGGLRTRGRISLAAARRGRLSVSFVVPTGARYVRVRLSRPGHTAFMRILAAGPAGGRQTVRLRGARLKTLVRGRYTVTVSAGAARTQLGTPVARRALRIG